MADRSPILILTRPEEAALAFSAKVERALGRKVETISSPLIRIESITVEPPGFPIGGVILTSANAVPAIGRLGIANGTPAFCVGGRTARSAREAGLDAQSADGDVEDLIKMILDLRPAGPLLHLKGEISRGDVADRLSTAGLACSELAVYRQIAQAPSAAALERLAGRQPIVMPLFSPRTGSILKQSGPFRAPVHAVAMSPAIAREIADAGFMEVQTVAAPDGPSMVEATAEKLRQLSPGAA